MDSLEIKSSDFGFQVFRSQKQYADHRRQEAAEYERRERLELGLIRRDGDSFMVPGWCAVCNCRTDFQVGFMYSYQSTPSGEPIPNWREHLNCMRCGHTNRVRLMLHLIDRYMRPPADAQIYISEQTTPLYHHLKNHFRLLQGSEYLGDAVAFGQVRDDLRNEDLTRLTFPGESFDLMISCDVLEHVTDDLAAFAECHRCLAPGGSLIFTAPCSLDHAKNVIRARMLPNGEIEHLITPPEYHGNPVDPENGALCFRYFGWEILEQLRLVGFKDAYALSAWSRSLGYLGIEQIVFVATKAA
jgi:SAM-dependent methyltransferase